MINSSAYQEHMAYVDAVWVRVCVLYVWVHCFLPFCYCPGINFKRIIPLWNISDDEDDEEEHRSISDDAVPPDSVGSCPSVKSPSCGDAGESGDEAPQCGSVTTGKPVEDKLSMYSPSSSNSHSQSGVLNPECGEDDLLISNSADTNSIIEATEIPENCASTLPTTSASHPEVTETCNNKKRKRGSKTKKTILQNGCIRRSDVR